MQNIDTLNKTELEKLLKELKLYQELVQKL